MADWLLPVLWCAFGVMKGVGNMFSGRAVDRVGPRPMILLGWLIYAVIYLAFAFASSAWHIWVLFVAYAFFYALTEPAEKTLVANLVGPERRGLAYGWYNGAIGIATLPASVLFGGLYDAFGRTPPSAPGLAWRCWRRSCCGGCAGRSRAPKSDPSARQFPPILVKQQTVPIA